MSNDFRTGENPFRSPTAVGVRSGTREDLFKVAKYQRGVLFCLLFQILIWAGSVVLSLGIGAPEPDAEAMPAIGQLLMSLALVVVSLTGVVVVLLLGVNFY